MSATGSGITIGIIIATYQRPDMLRRTLNSLADAQWPAAFVGIVVVENGPPAGAQAVCEAFQARPVRWVHEPQAGLSNARNRGAREMDADVLLFFDDDVVVTPAALTAYAAAITRHGAQRFYGGPVLPEYEGGAPPDWLLRHLPNSVKGLHFSGVDHEVNEPVFLGANFAVPKHGVNGEALFDPLSATGRSGGAVGEETRLQEQLLASGLGGYAVVDAAVWHWVPQRNCTPRWAVQRRYRHGYTDGYMEALHEGVTLRPWMLRRLVGTAVAAVGTRMSARNAEDRFRASIKHWYLRGYVRGVRDGLREEARAGDAG